MINDESDEQCEYQESYDTPCNNCGKEKPGMLVMNTNVFTLSEYLDFTENNEGLCIECFVNKKRSQLPPPEGGGLSVMTRATVD